MSDSPLLCNITFPRFSLYIKKEIKRTCIYQSKILPGGVGRKGPSWPPRAMYSRTKGILSLGKIAQIFCHPVREKPRKGPCWTRNNPVCLCHEAPEEKTAPSRMQRKSNHAPTMEGCACTHWVGKTGPEVIRSHVPRLCGPAQRML